MPADHSHRYVDHSAVVGLASAASARLRAWAATSWLAQIITTLETTLGDAARTSLLAAMLRTLEHYVRHSYGYRWLTAEPNPDVIVINLRETYLVGPFIALLDRVQPRIESAWNASAVRSLADRLEPNRKIVARSRTVALLAAALEPPEPPEQAREASHEDER